MITITNLTKRYGNLTAVDNLSLTIPQNQVFALLGVNGAGKTTTIKMLTGLTPKDEGTIYYDYLSMDTHLKQIQQQIASYPYSSCVKR